MATQLVFMNYLLYGEMLNQYFEVKVGKEETFQAQSI